MTTYPPTTSAHIFPPQLPLADQRVSLQQAARLVAVDVKTLRRRIADGSLPAVRVGVRKPGTVRDTRPIRVRVADVEALLQPIPAAPAPSAEVAR